MRTREGWTQQEDMGDKKGEMAGCGTKKYENGER
jgi:hypothetical protein